MKAWSWDRWYGRPVLSALLGLSALALSALAGGDGGPISGLDVPFTVPKVLLSHGLWKRRFGSNRDLIGQTLHQSQVLPCQLGTGVPLGSNSR